MTQPVSRARHSHVPAQPWQLARASDPSAGVSRLRIWAKRSSFPFSACKVSSFIWREKKILNTKMQRESSTAVSGDSAAARTRAQPVSPARAPRSRASPGRPTPRSRPAGHSGAPTAHTRNWRDTGCQGPLKEGITDTLRYKTTPRLCRAHAHLAVFESEMRASWPR